MLFFTIPRLVTIIILIIVFMQRFYSLTQLKKPSTQKETELTENFYSDTWNVKHTCIIRNFFRRSNEINNIKKRETKNGVVIIMTIYYKT